MIDTEITSTLMKFFTNRSGTDILPYSYLTEDDLYDQLIRLSDDYYLFRDEVDTIKLSTEFLKDFSKDISVFVEIGPGSDSSISNKTIPIVQCSLAQHKSYFAIDISQTYLDKIANFLSQHHPDLRVNTIQLDFLKLDKLVFSKERLCMLFLGSTLGNFPPSKQKKILQNIYSCLKKGDVLIITVDVNQDPASLLRAYSNPYAKSFAKNALSSLVTSFSQCKFNLDNLDVQCKWDKARGHINLYYVAKNDCVAKINDYEIYIRGGQKLYGIKSRKFKRSIIRGMINDAGFHIERELHNSGKITLLTCVRT